MDIAEIKRLSKERIKWKLSDLKKVRGVLVRSLNLYQGSQDDNFYKNLILRRESVNADISLLEAEFYKRL